MAEKQKIIITEDDVIPQFIKVHNCKPTKQNITNILEKLRTGAFEDIHCCVLDEKD